MGKVLRMYFISNWKLDAIIVTLVIISTAFFKNLNFVSLFIPFFIARATTADSKFNHLLKMLITMPVERQHIVKARFTYEAILVAAVFVPAGIILIIKNSYDIVTIAGATSAIIIFFNIFSAQAVATHFAMKKPDYFDYIFGIVPAFACIGIHVIFVIIANDENWWYLMLPIPIVSFVLLQHYYKKSLLQIRDKEFA